MATRCAALIFGVGVLVAACDVLPLGSAVWLPDDDLPVPAEVRTRPELPFCGVVRRTDGAPQERMDEVAACITDAIAAHRGAEAVVLYVDARRPHVDIVRALPGGGVEIFYRNVSGLGNVLWESQTCTGILGDGDELVIVEPCTEVVVLDG